MEEILKTIIENLVDNKDQVEVTRVDDERGTLLKVKVASEDMGKQLQLKNKQRLELYLRNKKWKNI